jgi:hypothetical protein
MIDASILAETLLDSRVQSMLEGSSHELKRHRSRLQTAQATATGPLNVLKDYITASSNCEYSNVFYTPYTRTQLE